MRMAAIQNEFTCPDKHKFNAIAKLRARCPSCGKMARRQFISQVAPAAPTSEPIKTTSPVSSHKVVTRKDTENGLKPGSTSAPVKSPESAPVKAEPKSSGESSPPKVKIIKQGRPATVTKATNPPSKQVSAKTRGPVKRVTAKSGHSPSVVKPPTGSKERKVIEQTTDEPFWHKVKRRYFL